MLLDAHGNEPCSRPDPIDFRNRRHARDVTPTERGDRYVLELPEIETEVARRHFDLPAVYGPPEHAVLLDHRAFVVRGAIHRIIHEWPKKMRRTGHEPREEVEGGRELQRQEDRDDKRYDTCHGPCVFRDD